MSNPQVNTLNEKRSSEHGSSDPEKADTAREEEAHTAGVLPPGTVDPVYEAKARVLNDAIQAIGMGRYQVCPVGSNIGGFLTSFSGICS
jgi:hypothetical protein